MKELKAYVRVNVLNDVVHVLERAGFKSMTIIDVSALGNLADPEKSEYSLEFVEKYSKMAKIEMVCRDEDVEKALDIIKKRGCTHQHGDGIVFVSDVVRAVKLRTGEEGDGVL
ncbi:MAG: P-II family nitrogen regulator [Bacteroidota bacterium]